MISQALTCFIEQNQRQLDENVHGVLSSLATAQALNNGAPINVTAGIGKLIIMLNAGADPNGTIVVTGDTVDRNTGAVTLGDTDTLTAAGLSTDNSGTDAEGNAVYDFDDGYMTSKWFRGAVTISTPAGDPVTLTDVDVWQCSFEQWNDENGVLDTFDVNAACTNTAAWLYAYLYSVIVPSPGRVSVTNEATLSVPAAVSEANKYYRLRRSPLGVNLDGATDGIFVDVNLGPNNQTYWVDFTMKVWRTIDLLTEDPDLAALQAQVQALACQSGRNCTALEISGVSRTAGDLLGG